jgi:hypothetical protein
LKEVSGLRLRTSGITFFPQWSVRPQIFIHFPKWSVIQFG